MPIQPALNSVETLLDVLHFADGDTAIIVPELRITVSYESLRQQVSAMASALASAGIRRGDRVAVAMPNGLPAIVSVLAASIAGTAAPLNPAFAYEEFLFFLRDTEARLLLCPLRGAELVRRAAADLNIPALSVIMTEQGVAWILDAPTGGKPAEPRGDDIALILHTSGSTGQPKRVPLQHSSLALSSANIAKSYSLANDDVSLCVMPLFHIHGLIGSAMSTLLLGGKLVLPEKFNALSFWRTVGEHRVTWYSSVPTMHQLTLARVQRPPEEAATLRFVRSCSAPISANLIQKAENLLGVPCVEAYGMTEAAHQMTSNPLPPRQRKPGSVGVETGIQIGVMDKYGTLLGTNQRGEVVIQGATVFRGYEKDSEHNRGFVEGWFRTGDEGYLDEDSYLYLTGRLKDIIIRGGEKIAPHAVDLVLLKHPAVTAAVTFGFTDPVWGEEIAAAVVLDQPNGATESQLSRHCREWLAEYECPKRFYLVEKIPTTATGKINRRAMEAALLSEKR